MTNKINGIDVSECEYFNSATYEEPYCNIDQERLYTCSNDENCYFKQLKRLQEELDIKEKMLDKFMIGSGETLKKLQEENEELKARLKTLDDEVLTVEITLDEFERYKKYKQALEEIRDILCNGRTFYEGYFDNPNLSRTDKAIKVINEVLNDRD